MDERAKRLGIRADRVLEEIAKLSFSNIKDFASWHEESVTFKDSDEIDSDKTACISEISQTTTEHGGTFRIKLHDKKGPLELLAKHLKLFVEEHKVKHEGNIEVIFNIPRPRKEGNEG